MIQEGEVEGQQGDQQDDDNADFSGAWDSLSKDEAGQPSLEDGRTDEDDESGSEGGDEAGQSGDAPPDAAADEASGETSDDLWANADPRLRSAYEQAENRARQAEHQARSNGGRAAQVAKELKELKVALASKQDADNATGEGDEAKTRSERLQQLREEYPDVATPILDQMERMEATLTELKAGQVQADPTDDLLAEQPRLLTEAHSDWQQVVQSDEYADWLNRQPPFLQRAMLEDNANQIVNAADCIAALDAFKQEQEQANGADPAASLAAKRERQLRAGTGVGRGAPPLQQREGGSFDSEWDRLKAEDQRRASRR